MLDSLLRDVGAADRSALARVGESTGDDGDLDARELYGRVKIKPLNS